MDQCDSLNGGVLLLEDDTLSALLATALIRRCGLPADWTDNSADAIALLRRAAAGQGGDLPAAIVADLNLRGGGAEEAIEWVRTSETARSIPVLVMSEDGAAQAKQRAMDCGADLYIEKSKVLRSLPKWFNASGAVAVYRDLCARREREAAAA